MRRGVSTGSPSLKRLKIPAKFSAQARDQFADGLTPYELRRYRLRKSSAHCESGWGYKLKFSLLFCQYMIKKYKGVCMREHLGFLKISSAVVKIAAWIFLILGIIGGVSIISGLATGNPRWMGLVILSIYVFSFFFFYLVAKIADLLIKIINEIKKE
jgi:hypothetical protein